MREDGFFGPRGGVAHAGEKSCLDAFHRRPRSGLGIKVTEGDWIRFAPIGTGMLTEGAWRLGCLIANGKQSFCVPFDWGFPTCFTCS